MKFSGVLILVVLIAAGVVVLLQSRDVDSKLDAVAVIATQLREEGVTSAAFDRDRALGVISVLDGLVADPQTISEHTDDLKTIAATAAGWADGAASPSAELHAAVAIRSAAGELRDYGLRPSSRTLDRARYDLARARDALTVASADSGVATSGMVTEGVRDRIKNLEDSQRERTQELEEEIGP